MTALFGKKSLGTADAAILFILATVIFLFIVSGFVAYSNTATLNKNVHLVLHTHDVIVTLADLESLMKDAESGQRGYLLTGEERYLEPYNYANVRLSKRMADLEAAIQDRTAQATHVEAIKSHIQAKLNELAETIALRRTRGFEAARAVVITDRGKTEMDAIRAGIASVKSEEQRLRADRRAEMERAYWTALISGVATCALGAVLACFLGYVLRRAAIIRRRQEWLQTGEIGLAKSMLGDLRVDELGENSLKFLAEYLDAQAGVFYARNGVTFRRVATYGVPDNGNTPERFDAKDGLLGQAVKDAKTFTINDLPDGYLNVGSALGHGNPRNLIVFPIISNGVVNAVIELGFIHPLDANAVDLLGQASEPIGMALKSANYRAHLQSLLEETQRQSEELQSQGEELRVSNEELEEQSRALKESQMRLEAQQAELEQNNAQLEEQTQLLETQNEDLERSRSSVQLKARELEQASQYKSDFLANMSHELRTPLNSSLILAKLLADNAPGNLNEEQVKFARTIQSSGNDLLMLINDILDLSKIEAGHVDIRPEPVLLERMARDLNAVFEPLARQKGLTLRIGMEPHIPRTVETDRQRLEQILKNLISNALKFTEKGGVEMMIGRAENGRDIAFSVSDTGIGIPAEQQQAIFEAFRQGDGTISRRYGGTGLGLSISRELSRLLGGTIAVKSAAGQGSVFTVTIPEIYKPQRAGAPFENPHQPLPHAPAAPQEQQAQTDIEDDRETLTKNGRVILIIEDDAAFAGILYDLARHLNFQCLIAATAEEGLALARQYLPQAVVLDVGLPDHSGLSVLDRLKRNTATRHIPVHVVSASDYTQTALSLGAAGYMIKPVKREELMDALKGLETKFSNHVRRVLIVEDDRVQRESMQKLLGSHDVETHGVSTAAECLECLKTERFDCMVLDLSLPDATGYSLLETLSKEQGYSFPPVIVYTGRALSAQEEQSLRRYSKSIIVKGAKSPERLLDEVTLFLHQVVSDLPAEQRKMLENVRNRDAILEGRRILIVEDDVANIYALTSILEPRGAHIAVARNGLEALAALEKSAASADQPIDLVLMDMMMPDMDGLTATREIRKRPEWKNLPVLMLTAKAMRDDQERCLQAGANDYMAKPLDVEKLLSLVRVWMPR